MCKVHNEKFAQLHLHTTHSQRDGAIPVRKLVDKCVDEFGQIAVGSTDHGTMAASWEIYNYATNIRKDYIKPIAGCEFYYNENRAELMEWLPYAKDVKDKEERKAIRQKLSKRYHFTAHALNREGYFNMIKMHNEAWINGFYMKPQVSTEMLENNTKGVAVFSGCQSGQIPNRIMAGQFDEAKRLIGWYKELYGDNFYLEIMPINSDVQRPLNEELIALSKSTKTPLIITNDSHYIEASDYQLHYLLLNLDNLKMDNDDPEKTQKMWEFDVDDLYIKSAEQMYSSWKESHKTNVFTEKVFLGAMENVYNLVESVTEYDLETEPMLPKLAENEWEKLCELTVKGLREKLAGGLIPLDRIGVYKARISQELETIRDVKAVDYILACWDITRFCSEQDIAVGAGRGCFTPENMVKLSDGSNIRIGDVKEGDTVSNHFNGEATVERIWEYDVNEELVILDFGSTKIRCTKDHKFYTNNRGWVAADELTPEDDVAEI